jgi:hypothetical protein
MTELTTLTGWLRTRKLPAMGTPILATHSELVGCFRKAAYREQRFPRGTPGLLISPLGGGVFATYLTCPSTRDEECWIDPRSGNCLCREREAPGTGRGEVLPPPACRFDFQTFGCFGGCPGTSEACGFAFTFTRSARLTSGAMLPADTSKLTFAQALTAATASSPQRELLFRLFLACACV